MDRKIKIALLGPYEPEPQKIVGGAHVDTFNLVQGLKKYSDIEVHVITLSNSIEHDKEIEDGNLIIHYLKSPRLPRLITSLTIDQYKVMRKVREVNPDIIHAQSTAPLYGFTASLLKTYPTLLRVHGIVMEEAKTWSGPVGYTKGIIYGLMEKYALRRVKDVIVITDYVKEKIMSLCASEIHVIPVGVDGKYFDVVTNEVEARLLFVGGIEPRKGLIHLLKAVEIVRKKIPTTSLHIVGTIRKRKYFNELIQYTKDKNLADNVKYVGTLTGDTLRKEYGECSVFVLPSREESQGLVLLEAMACGKPAVASNIGGIPHVVDDGKTGFLVEYGNPEELAEKIMTLLEDVGLRGSMGKEGKEKARQFSQGDITKKIYALYMKIINQKT